MQSTASIQLRIFSPGKHSSSEDIPETGPAGFSEKFPIQNGQQIELIDINEIVYCKASSNHTEIHLTNGRRKLLPKTLKWTEMMLRSNPMFRRLHHAYLVNLSYVTALEKASMWHLEVDGVRLPVSRIGKNQLQFLIRH